jgi:DNA-binding IclR family transcriptional regulator
MGYSSILILASRRYGRFLHESYRRPYHSQSMNIAGISAPVLRADGRVIGSIGVIMPASRFSRSVQERLPAAVIESARKLGTVVTG